MTDVLLLSDPITRGADPAGLSAIHDSDCALAIWNRPRDPALSAIIDALDLDAVDNIDAAIPVARSALHAAVLLGAAGYAGDAAVALATEIEAMVDRLAFVARCHRVRFRLEVVETDACRRFHADMVTMRLIVTWRGPGTQWIAADRPDVVEEVPAGAVALFKGRRLMPEPTVLHRSPPIAGTGVRRLVLVLDPLSAGDTG